MNSASISPTCVPLSALGHCSLRFSLLQFPVPAELDHGTMLTKVRIFPYVLPETFSSALIFLLNEVCKCHSPLSTLYTVIRLNCLSVSISLHRCSFCARIQPTGFVTWSVLRCRPSFVALRLTLSSFKRHLSTSSLSSGLILIGQPKRGEAFRRATLTALTVIRSCVLLQVPVNCLLLWPAWT